MQLRSRPPACRQQCSQQQWGSSTVRNGAGLSRCRSAEPAAQQSIEAEPENPEVSVRRRPPLGYDTIGLLNNQVGYKVGNLPEINQPRSLLEEMVWYKAREIENWRDKQPLVMLQMLARKAAPSRDFKAAVLQKAKDSGKPALIAEVCKPEDGDQQQPPHDPVAQARQFEAAGAACLSVVTDERYLRGSWPSLGLVKKAVACPLLCRDVVVEAYQLFKARASGADAVLLLAAVLPNQDLKYMCKVAKALGMCCVIEVHTEAELSRVLQLEGLESHLLAVNNKDLATSEVDLGITQRLMEGPAGAVVKQRGLAVVGTGGITSAADVAALQAAGVSAVLVDDSGLLAL